MYEDAIPVIKKYLLYRPMTVGDKDILLAGTVTTNEKGEIQSSKPSMEHLACFTGGMLALAGKVFSRPGDVADAKRITDGCVWAYRSTPSGIMPEGFDAVPCPDKAGCAWDEKLWFKAVDPSGTDESARAKINDERLPPGFASVGNRHYLLRYVTGSSCFPP
jgi:mannosyl-oligosaccharide alpha-1,2-mannosidase